MKVYIASDHGGFELKNKILDKFNNFRDLGPYKLNPNDDYPDYALKVANKISEEEDSRGILICRSGNGMCIAANKVKGAYAALAFGTKHARKAVEHDNANILCIDSDYEGEDSLKIIESFLNAKFEGLETRHGRRFLKILEIENNY